MRRSERLPRAVSSTPTLATDTYTMADASPALARPELVHFCSQIRRSLTRCSRTHATSWCAARRARSAGGGGASIAPARGLSGMVRFARCGYRGERRGRFCVRSRHRAAVGFRLRRARNGTCVVAVLRHMAQKTRLSGGFQKSIACPGVQSNPRARRPGEEGMQKQSRK